MSVHQALMRPKDYDLLFPREQWEINRELGILDWNPTPKECKEYLEYLRLRAEP